MFNNLSTLISEINNATINFSDKTNLFIKLKSNVLIDYYKNELAINGNIPYSEVQLYINEDKNPPDLIISNDHFKFPTDNDTINKIILSNPKDISFCSTITRLFATDSDNRILCIQKAKYCQQACSNMIADWKLETTSTTLREITSQNKSLPPLSKSYLANNLGVACIILYKSNDELMPYLVCRSSNSKDVSVYEGGFHCTASGSVEWIDEWEDREHINISEIGISHIYTELEEEIGLTSDDLEEIGPNNEKIILCSLCREFPRCGKPQLFFVGYTEKSPEELKQIRISKSTPSTEIAEGNFPHDSLDALLNDLKNKGITTEAAANLYYANKVYLE